MDPIEELGGLRALARSLVQGDADADDLMQDAAVAVLEHPPDLDRPVRPWLATVILNRWRMNRRGHARRRARELAVEVPVVDQVDTFERALTLRRLGEAVGALAEPYRYTVIARYFDGKTSIQIAREHGIPPVTVRTRLSRALDQLRATLDEQAPRRRWQRALLPLQGGWLVKAKTTYSLLAAFALLLLVAGAGWWLWPRGGDSAQPAAASRARTVVPGRIELGATAAPTVESASLGQRRAAVAQIQQPGGAASGHVIDWSTGRAVAGAELTFTGEGAAQSVKTDGDGAFELVAARPGSFALASATAAGYLPYSPEFLHSTVHFELTRDRSVTGLTVYVFPALDYHGRVVDETGKPVAGAKVALVGTPTGEQFIDRQEAAWTSDRDGKFTFHAADEAVLEASAGDRHGWAQLDGDVAITKDLQITIAKVPARDGVITGRVVDEEGRPLADVLVRADPITARTEPFPRPGPPRANAFAISEPDGSFRLGGLDRDEYGLLAEAQGRAQQSKSHVFAGAREVVVTMPVGELIAGRVVASDGTPVPAFTLLAYRRNGAARGLIEAKSFVDPNGKFELHVEKADYELIASATGWAPSPATLASAPSQNVVVKVSAGATLVGTVVSGADGSSVRYARVMREAASGGASAAPANAGTVTREDGSFVLTGIPPGSVSITIAADSFDRKIEAGMTANDGDQLGPIAITLTPLVPGATPKLELVGIGVALTADGDDLLVQNVIAHSGAQAAGIIAGDRIVAVDGASVTDLGLEGAIARVRGVVNTTVAISLKRGDGVVTLAVTRTKLQA